MYERIRHLLLTHTRLNSPRVRRAVRAFKRRRRIVFERLGSDRYAHPALDGLDRKLSAHLPERGGVFIEAGAFDGYWQSNTYWFERFRGWSGILIEPIPEFAALARRERPGSRVVEVALVAPDFEPETVRMRVGGTMSVLLSSPERLNGALTHAERGASIAKVSSYELDVPAATLSAVLDTAGIAHVDLLSLDVEGHELDVLRGLDMPRHRPRFILVEILDDDRGAAVYELLEPYYAFVERLSGRDHLFRARHRSS